MSGPVFRVVGCKKSRRWRYQQSVASHERATETRTHVTLHVSRASCACRVTQQELCNTKAPLQPGMAFRLASRYQNINLIHIVLRVIKRPELPNFLLTLYRVSPENSESQDNMAPLTPPTSLDTGLIPPCFLTSEEEQQAFSQLNLFLDVHNSSHSKRPFSDSLVDLH